MYQREEQIRFWIGVGTQPPEPSRERFSKQTMHASNHRQVSKTQSHKSLANYGPNIGIPSDSVISCLSGHLYLNHVHLSLTSNRVFKKPIEQCNKSPSRPHFYFDVSSNYRVSFSLCCTNPQMCKSAHSMFWAEEHIAFSFPSSFFYFMRHAATHLACYWLLFWL